MRTQRPIRCTVARRGSNSILQFCPPPPSIDHKVPPFVVAPLVLRKNGPQNGEPQIAVCTPNLCSDVSNRTPPRSRSSTCGQPEERSVPLLPWPPRLVLLVWYASPGVCLPCWFAHTFFPNSRPKRSAKISPKPPQAGRVSASRSNLLSRTVKQPSPSSPPPLPLSSRPSRVRRLDCPPTLINLSSRAPT